MRSIAIHYLTETELGIKSHENLPEFYSEADVPAGIESIIVQSVISESIYFLGTVYLNTANGSISVKFCFSAYATGQIRTGCNDKISIVCNVESELYIDWKLKIQLIYFHVCIGICNVAFIIT